MLTFVRVKYEVRGVELVRIVRRAYVVMVLMVSVEVLIVSVMQIVVVEVEINVAAARAIRCRDATV